MVRRAFLFLSEREGLKDLLLRLPVFRRVAHRFVAGDALGDALEAAAELNRDGLRVTLDHLGGASPTGPRPIAPWTPSSGASTPSAGGTSGPPSRSS